MIENLHCWVQPRPQIAQLAITAVGFPFIPELIGVVVAQPSLSAILRAAARRDSWSSVVPRRGNLPTSAHDLRPFATRGLTGTTAEELAAAPPGDSNRTMAEELAAAHTGATAATYAGGSECGVSEMGMSSP